MKHKSYIYTALLALATAIPSAAGKLPVKIVGGKVGVENVKTIKSGEQMDVSMNFVLDSLHMPLNRRIVLTPYMVSAAGDSVFFRPVVINDRRQQVMYDRRDHRRYDAADAYVVRRKNGSQQSLQYFASAPYANWMQQAKVKVSEDLCGCGDVKNQTAETLKKMYTPQCAFLAPVAAATKTYEMHGRAFIDFPVDRTELHPDYRQNPRELAKIVDTINIIKRDPLMTITNIDIHGYASPESPYEHNAWLAEHRAATLKNYVRQLVKLDDRLFSVHFTPEDWDGLRTYLRESNIDNRDAILAIACDTTLAPDPREWAIKTRYPDEYRTMLATWYPALRHSDYIVTCTVRPFSVDEAKELIKTRPQLLSENEMFLVAQTYEPGSKEFNDVMETAVRMFPNDATANLNAACTRLQEGRYDLAKAYLDKAGDSPEADNARGVYYWMSGDEEHALEFFIKADEAGNAMARTNLEELGVERK